MKTIKLTLSDSIVAALLEKTVAEQEKYRAASVTFPEESQRLISAGDKIREIFEAAEVDKPMELDTSAMEESSTQEFTKGLHYTLENYFLSLLHGILKVNLLTFKLNHEDALASNDFEKQDKESYKKQVQFTENILKAINSGTVDLPISVTSPEDSKQLSQNLAQLILTCIGEL